MKTGVNMSPMHVANIAKAANSSPPKTSRRSHRLTAGCQQNSRMIVSLSMHAPTLETLYAGTPFSHTQVGGASKIW